MRSSVILALSASVSAVVLAAPAWAQTAAPQSASTKPSTTISEIIVTANKRSENLQEVASSVSAQTGASLERNKLEQLTDYAAYVPGLSVNSEGAPGEATITVRGISPLSSGSTVATYIDDSPLGSSGIWARSYEFNLDMLPFDLDRLELLRGPQGTLYGADAIGGVLKYVLTTPNTHQFEADAGADVYGIDGSGGVGRTFDGRVNIPIKTDELALSVSAYDKFTPGYVDNLATGQQDVNHNSRYGGRVALYWTPTSQLSVKLDALYQHNHSNDDSVVSYPDLTQQTGSNGVIYVSPSGGLDNRLTENHPLLQPFSTSNQFYSATINWNVGPVDLISATSFSRSDAHQTQDASFIYGAAFPLLTGGAVPAGLSPFYLSIGTDKFTQEFRATSSQHQAIDWQIGVFYTEEWVSNVQSVYGFDDQHNPIPAFQPNLAYLTLPTTYREIAGFGDATWHITSQLDVTGGVRVAYNEQKFSETESGILIGPTTSVANASNDEVNTWMVDVRYHFTPAIMAYGRVATGYAPGGPNSPVPGYTIPATVGPETLTNYEVGLKSEFLDRRLRINLSVFDLQWNDIQLDATLNGITYLNNGGNATSRGFEFEGSFVPVRGLNIGLNAAYTDSYLYSLKPGVSEDYLLHTQLPLVPRWMVSAPIEYTFALTPDLAAHVGGGVRWVDQEWATPLAVGKPAYALPAYAVVDINASVTHGPWTYLAYVRNLGNVRAVQGAYDQQDILGNSKQLDYYILQPLTFGVGLQVKFY